jgi:ComF family protein
MSIITIFKRGYKDVLNILYPRLCLSCDNVLHDTEVLVCHQCLSQLSLTNFQPDDNPIKTRLLPIVNIQNATALFLFDKSGIIQELIHKLKYEGHQDIGVLMAQFAQDYFNQFKLGATIDLIVPVPLHPKKLKQRGYNQMTKFGKNLGNYFSVPYQEDVLLRRRHTTSQTKKTARERRENVSGAFVVKSPASFTGKHFLIIDDVMTTGATIEACAETILRQVPDAKVSVLTMAVVL